MDDNYKISKNNLTAPLFDYIADIYGGNQIRAELEIFLRSCFSHQDCSGKIVVDIGCGTGDSFIFFAKMKAIHMVGVDTSFQSLKVARNKFEKVEVFPVSFVAAKASTLPFADEAFNVVFSKGTLAYVREISQTIDECLRITKERGVIILEFLRKTHILMLVEYARKICNRIKSQKYRKIAPKILAVLIFPCARLLLGRKARLASGKRLEQIVVETFFSPTGFTAVKPETVLSYLRDTLNLEAYILDIPTSPVHSSSTSFVVKIIRKRRDAHKTTKPRGVMGVWYSHDRLARRAPRYRLARRSQEVLKAIQKHKGYHIGNFLDVGTADGLMIERLKADFPVFTVGVDFSFEMLTSNPKRTFHPIQADVLKLPFLLQTFDVVIATAVIEHVVDGEKLLKECFRVLKKGGLCILTTPVPFFDRIYALFQPKEREFHHKLFTLRELRVILEKCGFQVVKAEKFMISPIGLPFELKIERLIKLLKLNFLLLNQLIVGRKL